MPAAPGVDCPLGWQGACGGLRLHGTSSPMPFTECDLAPEVIGGLPGSSTGTFVECDGAGSFRSSSWAACRDESIRFHARRCHGPSRLPRELSEPSRSR